MDNIFKGYKDGHDFIMRGIKKGFFPILDLKTIAALKEQLLSFKESDLRTIRGSLNASYGKYTNISPLGIFLTIIFSGCFTMLSNYAITAFNFDSNLYIDSIRGSFQENDSLSSQVRSILGNAFQGDNVKEAFKGLFLDNIGFYFRLFGSFLLTVLVIILYYFFRLNRISKLKFLLDEVLEEKSKMERMVTATSPTRRKKR